MVSQVVKFPLVKTTKVDGVNFTPEYFFRSHHKFNWYLPRVKLYVADLKGRKECSSINFTWYLEKQYYHVAVYGTMNKGAPITFEIFKTRYQRDAYIAIWFFKQLFNTSSSPRIAHKPSDVDGMNLHQVREALIKEMATRASEHEKVNSNTGLMLEYIDYIGDLQERYHSYAVVASDLKPHFAWLERCEKKYSMFEFAKLVLSQVRLMKAKFSN